MPSKEQFFNIARWFFEDNRIGNATSAHYYAHQGKRFKDPKEAVENARAYVFEDLPKIGVDLIEEQLQMIREMLEAHTPGSPTYEEHDY